MMKSKLIGSMEALDNFQFVTINGKVVFEDKDKVVRIARAYSQVVKSAIKPLFVTGRVLTNRLRSFTTSYQIMFTLKPL
jgi:3-deoxy-D-manno-octulosonic acid (KDO) 8-phosphate synthase